MQFGPLNIWAILNGTVFNMVLGALWYSPALFGNLWLRSIERERDELESNPTDYLWSALAGLIAAVTLNLVVRAFGATTFSHGALIGALVCIGFCGTASLVYTLFEGPPKKVWLIFASYQLVVYVAEGILFALWA